MTKEYEQDERADEVPGDECYAYIDGKYLCREELKEIEEEMQYQLDVQNAADGR